jgi:hypothetical protein
VTVVDLTDDPASGEHLRTEECALCGATRGEDYTQFSTHLKNDHAPGDVGRSRPLGERRTARGGA